jgi:hypothetical protein
MLHTQIIGLAIYNSVILDLHFPVVVYQKLLGVTPTLRSASRRRAVCVRVRVRLCVRVRVRPCACACVCCVCARRYRQHLRALDCSLTHPASRCRVAVCGSDLALWKPDIARNLHMLLDYPGDDLEFVFSLTFTIAYEVRVTGVWCCWWHASARV